MASLKTHLTIERLNPRDIAKAALRFSSELYFTVEDKRWLRWNGQYYEDYTNGLRTELLQAVVEVARFRVKQEFDTAEDKSGMRGVLAKRLYSFSGASFPHDIESLMRDLSLCSVEEFDEDSSLFVCSSGVLDRAAARRGEIVWLPHDPARLVTKCISVEYEPDATCDENRAFLASSIPDGGARLQVMIGFALVGDNSKKKRIVNLIGPTDTGKSTVLDILGDILRPYLGNMRTEEIVVSRHNSKFDFHGLRNARGVFLSEPDQHSRFRIGELKRITGGESMSTEGKGTAPVTWRASVMPFIGTNYEINFDTTDGAFENRLEYIYFKRTRAIDHNLKRKLHAERSGIFNWVLEGILRYFEGELQDTEESLAARQRAISAVEPPLQFLDFGIDTGMIRVVAEDYPMYKCWAVSQLYARYKTWHIEEFGIKGTPPYGRKRFSEVVQKRYPTCDRTQTKGTVNFIGIAPVLMDDGAK